MRLNIQSMDVGGELKWVIIMQFSELMNKATRNEDSFLTLPSLQTANNRAFLAILALINIPSGQSSAKLPVILSLGHSVTWSLGPLVTWSLGHSVTWSLCHSVTLSLCHSVTRSCHSVTWSHGHLVTRSFIIPLFIFNIATN